jgi:hypothetical protein
LIESCRAIPKNERPAQTARLILMTPEYQIA